MPQAARAQDWSDPPPRRRTRRDAEDWASADDLEILGSIGRPREADWTVLTLEREDEGRDVLVDAYADEDTYFEDEPVAMPEPVQAAPRARRRLRAVEDMPEPDGHMHLVPSTPTPAPLELPEERPLAESGRRTVVIRGRGDERQDVAPSGAQRHRPARRPSERVGQRPDRVALWALGLGVMLILVAILSAGGA